MEWNFDLPRLRSLNKYWRKYPPTHILMKHYVGYKEPEDNDHIESDSGKKQEVLSEDSLAEFIANVPKYEFRPPIARDNGNESKP